MNGQQLAVYETMKKFIETRYYADEALAVGKIKSFNFTDDLTADQYTDLLLLARDTYNPYVPPVEVPTEPGPEDPVV